MSVQIYKFSDGLRLVHEYVDTTRSVAVMVLCGVGSQNEDEHTNGMAHFIEHNVFKGTPTRTSFDIVKELDMIGAQYNAFTSKQNTGFYAVAMDYEADSCTQILADILTNPTFDAKEMESERKVILEEIAMSEDDNADLCQDLVAEAFYGANTPHGRTILGPAKNIKKFTREDVIKFKEQNYVSNDIVISICGNISLDKAKDLCKKYFVGKFPQNPNREWQDSKEKTFYTNYIKKFKDIEQANIFLAMPSYGFLSDKKNATTIAMDIFGGGMSSRLFQEIREKRGLAYSVYSYNSVLNYSGVSYLYIGTNKGAVQESLEVTRDLIKKVAKEGFDHDEIVKGINSGLTRLTLGNESTIGKVRVNAQYALFANDAYDVDKVIDDVKNLTVDDLSEVFRETMDLSKASVAYVGREVQGNLLDIIKA